MSSYSKAQFMGRLTADPTTKTIGDATLCTFSLAINETVKGERTASFYDFEAWRQAGDYIAKYAKKGDAVYLDADIKQDKFEGKDGKPQRKVKFVVKPMSFGFAAGNKDDNAAAPKVPTKVAANIPEDDEDVPY